MNASHHRAYLHVTPHAYRRRAGTQVQTTYPRICAKAAVPSGAEQSCRSIPPRPSPFLPFAFTFAALPRNKASIHSRAEPSRIHSFST